ncbi:MAG: hypothetical protein WBK19_10570 [Azonexus sp.]
MSDLKIQGEVQLSSEGAEAALENLGNKAEKMASRLQTEAGKAGQAVDGIGNGAAESAEKFTRAEGRIVESIKRATTNLELFGKTASQKLEFKIDQKGLDASKFEPLLAKMRELEAAQVRVATTGRSFGSGLQNTSYQLQDFIVQVNGGTDATKALGQQLPQMLVGFGAAGAAVGVLAAALPNLVAAFSSSAGGAKDFKEAMSDFDKAIGDVGAATKTFDMDKLYEEFNKSSAAVRAATIEQLNFQQEYIRTTQMVSSKKFGESLGGLGDYSTLDKLAGSFGGTGPEKLAKQLGVTLDTAKNLMPVIAGLKSGTEDVGLAFNQFGTTLLGGNAKAVELATTMVTLAKSEKDAASAASSLSEAQAKMSKGHVQTKKEAEEAKDARKSAIKDAEALAAVMDKLTGRDTGLDATYWKDLETLHSAYSKGRLSVDEYREAVGKLTKEQKFAKDAAKAEADALKERSKWLDEWADSRAKETKDIADQNAKAQEYFNNLGLTKSAQEELAASKLELVAAAKEEYAANLENAAGYAGEFKDAYLEAAEAARSQAAALRDLSVLKRQTAAKEIAVNEANEASKAWGKFADDIERSLTDSLFRSFESGKSFGESFADSLENTFKTMALKFAINYVVNGAGQLVGMAGNSAINAVRGTGSSNNGSGINYLGAANNLSTANSLYGALAGLSGTTVGASGASLIYANGVGMVGGDSLGALIAANGSWSGVSTGAAAGGSSAAGGSAAGGSSAAGGVATIAWVAAIVAGMWMSSEAWKAGIRWENYAKQADVALWDAEVAIRAAHDEPARAIFGDDFVNSQFYAIMGGGSLSAQIHYGIQSALFGSKYQTGTQTAGTFSESGQGFYGAYGVNMKKTGGLFSGGREWTEWHALPDDIDSIMDAVYRGVRNSFIMLGETFDDTSLAAKMQGFVYEFQSGSTDIQHVVESATIGLSETIGAILVPSIDSLRASGESWVTAFERIITESSAVSRVLDLMGRTMSGTFGTNNLDGVLKASDALVGLFGSIETFNTAFTSYYGNFYSQQDQVAQAWEEMSTLFDKLDKTMPTTRQGFRDLVDSLDLSTEAGRTAFTVLMGLQGAFASLTPTIEEATAAAAAQANSAREMQASQIAQFYDFQRSAAEQSLKNGQTAAQLAASTASSLISSFEAIVDNLDAYRASLLSGSGSLSPADQYAEAKRAYESTASQAKLGDINAANNLQTYADAFLAASMQISTATGYARDFASVVGTVDAVTGIAERQIPIAQSQLDVANEQLATLTAMLDSMNGGQAPVMVANYGQAATDWASFFSTTAVGDVVQNAAGAMQRISESMGLFIDNTGAGFTFSSSDSPYALAGESAAWRDEMLRRYGAWSVPSFASGGTHSGGLRLVGENGPEMEITGPSNIVNSDRTGSLMDNFENMVAELRALRQEVATLRSETRSGHAVIASNTKSTAKSLEKFDIDGMPEVRAA